MSEAVAKPVVNSRGAFYRLCRMLHGYLSAAAFLALLFFAATGILLNHPEWMPERAPAQREALTLDGATLARIGAIDVERQPASLAAEIAARTEIAGAFTSGEVFDTEALLRFEGARGNSTATVDLSTGAVEVEVERADAVAVLNDLHRGKNAGAAWKWVIDVVGALTIALSLIGFLIFFSLRFRLATSLALVVGGAAAMVLVFFTLAT